MHRGPHVGRLRGQPRLAYDPPMRSIVCLNGPNLDQLGSRDPAIYGDRTLAELEEQVMAWGAALGYEVACFQSNHEGELVEAVHRIGDADGVVINPGALTHSSPALGDALASCPVPVVEVHLSNIRQRERWRRRSFVAGPATRSIVGRGPEGYRSALRHIANRATWPVQTVRYGPHPDQLIDLRQVDGATNGVVLIHGGFWGDVWEADTVESWAVDLARRSLPSAVIEFRRVGFGGGLPATTSDVSAAIETAVTALDLTAFALVGHSSGGHLAVWATGDSGRPPAVTVAISGIMDLEQAEMDGLGDGAVRRFDPGHSTSAMSAPLPPAPIALIHGESDMVVPPAQSISYSAHLHSHGARVTLDLVNGGHFDALDPRSDAWTTAVARLAEHLG